MLTASKTAFWGATISEYSNAILYKLFEERIFLLNLQIQKKHKQHKAYYHDLHTKTY